LREDSAFVDWLRTAEDIPLKTSICTGSLLLGVASALDLGLHVVERLAGAEARDTAAREMDDPYRPSLLEG